MLGRKKAVVVKEYRHTRDYERDARKMLAQGYVMQGAPVERKLGIGPVAQYWSRKLVVTYVLAK